MRNGSFFRVVWLMVLSWGCTGSDDGPAAAESAMCDGAQLAAMTTLDRCRKCGEDCAPFTVATSKPFGTTYLALDATHVYWTRGTPIFDAPPLFDGVVMSAPLSGGTSRLVASGQNIPSSVAARDGAVFWTDQQMGVFTAAPAGSPRRLADGGLNVTDIAVDDGAVYWSDASIEGKGFIKRVALDDGTETTLATDLDGFVSSLTVDSTHLHWAQSEPIKLMRAPLQGGTATELFRNESGDHPSLVMTKEGVVASGFTIPVAASGQQILLFPFDGGTPRLLASAPAIMHIASNGERVYFTTPGEDGAVQSILSVALQGGTPEVVADRVPYLMAIAAYGDVLCWIRTVELSEIVCRKV